MSHSIRKQITNQIVKAIEEDDLLPWRRPWNSSPNAGRPMNVKSGAAYQGINPLLLNLHSQKHGFTSRYSATYKQWESLGCKVQPRPADVERGKWGCSIVFYKPVKKATVNKDTGEEEQDEFLLMKTYVVFNADQVQGADAWRVKDEQPAVPQNFAPAEELIAATGADLRFGGDEAYYARPLPEKSWPNHTSGDYIQLPPKQQFDPSSAFYETALHELAHWSEVRSRKGDQNFGYAMSELVAELASCFLASELGVPVGETLGNHAAYLKSWLSGMKENVAFIFLASTQASKVTDFLLSFRPVAVEEPASA